MCPCFSDPGPHYWCLALFCLVSCRTRLSSIFIIPRTEIYSIAMCYILLAQDSLHGYWWSVAKLVNIFCLFFEFGHLMISSICIRMRTDTITWGRCSDIMLRCNVTIRGQIQAYVYVAQQCICTIQCSPIEKFWNLAIKVEFQSICWFIYS